MVMVGEGRGKGGEAGENRFSKSAFFLFFLLNIIYSTQ